MTSVLENVEFTFRSTIAVDEIERLLVESDPRCDAGRSWTLDLTAVRHVQPGAGYRLAHALSRWSRGEVVARVPDPGGFSGRWFQTFTRSGLGLALARHANSIVSGDEDISEQVRAYYADKGATSGQNYGVRANIDDGSLTADVDRFAAAFLRLGAYVDLERSVLAPEERRALVGLAYEATTNVVDHAYKAPWEVRESALSYLSLSRYETLRAQAGERLAEYLGRANAALAEADEATLGWVEILVCDDGVGIAARQSGNADIASEAIQVEREYLQEALSTGGSIKLVTRDAVTIGEPGYGFTLIAGALARLNGYAALRTGRLLAECDGTLPEESGFALGDHVLGWVPGTALHVVLPLRDPQLRILPA